MNLYNKIKNDIEASLETLKNGGIILYPTDTIWGLGCDASNAEAVAKIYQIKKRSDTRSMLILLENENRLPSYVKEVPDIAWELIEVSDKPLTIVYPGAKNLAANLISEDGSIGIRITREEFTVELLKKFRKPIVSTSANISESPSPERFDDISDEIKTNADYIVNYRQDDLNKAKASSIIKLDENGQIRILRK